MHLQVNISPGTFRCLLLISSLNQVSSLEPDILILFSSKTANEFLFWNSLNYLIFQGHDIRK